MADIIDFRMRSKKVASLITQKIDDTIAMSLDVHGCDPVLMWIQLEEDYNTVTSTRRSAARKEFLDFITSQTSVAELLCSLYVYVTVTNTLTVLFDMTMRQECKDYRLRSS